VDIYRRIWTAAWLAIGVVPVFFGLLVASPVALFCAAVVTAVCLALIADRAPMDCAAAGVVAAMTVAAMWWVGPPALAALALMGATSPSAVAWLAHAVRPPQQAADLVALDDTRLCAAWSESYVALQRAQSAAERLAIVNARQAYLDELEARNATGFRTWLHSAARPVGNPQPFIDPH
jgi:hypothetical protein